uniref:Uncharacterized protein n=1 Tax=uncultured Thiotrichaceae bacterium TaxID=298394 RepID=A0A6S6UBR7_9GAMM|nr:MAG: Unknown protein [uncultured Thiotrichaceae bacterium]
MVDFPKKHRVAFDGTFDLNAAASEPLAKTNDKQLKKRLKKLTKRIDE